MLFYTDEDPINKNRSFYLNKVLKALYRNGGVLSKSKLWGLCKHNLIWLDYEGLLKTLIADKKIRIEEIKTKTRTGYRVILNPAW